MKLDVVEQDDVPGAQAGDEQVLDVELKDLRVDCPLNGHWCADPVQPQGAENRDVTAVLEGFGDFHSLANRGAGMGARHCQINAEFIHEDQVFPHQRLLFLLECGSLLGVGLGRERGLFFATTPALASHDRWC